MNKPDVNFRNVIGKRINRDIFSDSGILLIPNSSIITYDHAKILEKHNIVLTSQDISPVGPYTKMKYDQLDKMIDETVWQGRLLFEEVRETKKIPIAELRQDVIPVIHEAARSEHLFDLFASLQAKDDYTYRHNIAVGVIANLIGTWMRLGQQELLQLTTAAFLHDIGKMLIPQDIINKPGKLTEEEYAVMKTHTVLGYELMKETFGITHRQALVALQHHERMDGSGYPFGLTKNRIDLFSRIVSVADIFHAMTSKRAYRNPSPFYEVLFQIEKDTFGVLDPAITRLFIEKIMNYLIGKTVLLTDGREGTILMVQAHDLTHPLIQVGNEFIDLSKDFSVHIKYIL
jgi:HD-GYP domain-containing protein (c-di-GMP phosphodiesterase class II)